MHLTHRSFSLPAFFQLECPEATDNERFTRGARTNSYSPSPFHTQKHTQRRGKLYKNKQGNEGYPPPSTCALQPPPDLAPILYFVNRRDIIILFVTNKQPHSSKTSPRLLLVQGGQQGSVKRASEERKGKPRDNKSKHVVIHTCALARRHTHTHT